MTTKIDTFAFLTPGETDRPILDHLHDRLVDAAATEQVLDVAYTTMDSPPGRPPRPPPRTGWSGWHMRARTTTRCCSRLP